MGLQRKGQRIFDDKVKTSESKNILFTVAVGIVTLLSWVPTVLTSIRSHTYIILLSGLHKIKY